MFFIHATKEWSVGQCLPPTIGGYSGSLRPSWFPQPGRVSSFAVFVSFLWSGGDLRYSALPWRYHKKRLREEIVAPTRQGGAKDLSGGPRGATIDRFLVRSEYKYYRNCSNCWQSASRSTAGLGCCLRTNECLHT